MVWRTKGPQTGPKVELHCASCDTWICSYYEYPRGSGVVHPRFDKRLKNVERISPDREPIETAVFVFRCPKRSCQRAHVLRGASIADCCRVALRRRAKQATLPADDG
jgi:hypothetical protein